MPRQEDTPMRESTRFDPGTGHAQSVEDDDRATQVTETVRDSGRSAQDTAGRFVDQGRERVTNQLGDQKMRLASGLGSVSEAVRTAGQHLREQDQSGFAQFADQGAGQIDHIAQYLQNRDVNELLGEAESFARQRPEVFLGAAFGLGVVAARFLKSSGPQGGSSGY